MAKIIKPPTALTAERIQARPSIALFGSIEQGNAVQWQKACEDKLSEYDIDIYNPRRDLWNPSWEQTETNTQFKEQVEWELLVLENVNVRLFYFDPKTKSPVSLLELGLSVMMGTMDNIVCCPDGYWRKGNVDIVCKHYGVHMELNLEDALADALSRLTTYHGVPRKYTEYKEPAVPVVELIDVIENG